MIGYFDREKLNDLLKDFYNAVGIKISIFDTEFHMVTEYPYIHPEYCRLIRSTEEGLNDCRTCDKSACIRAKMLKKAHVYTCHAGLTEAITPIEVNGAIIGYAILAHMLKEEDCFKAVNAAVGLSRKYGITENDARNALEKISPRKTSQIESSVAVLDVLAKYLRLSDMVRWENENISESIDRFIRNNLDKKITSQDIMQTFGLSRTYLYNISVKSFGTGIMQYVNGLKMDKAMELLKKGDSVSSVCSSLGFSDVSYFTKVFKNAFGVLPSAVRR